MYFVRDPQSRTLTFSEFDARKFEAAIADGMEIVEETEGGRRMLSRQEITSEEAAHGDI